MQRFPLPDPAFRGAFGERSREQAWEQGIILPGAPGSQVEELLQVPDTLADPEHLVRIKVVSGGLQTGLADWDVIALFPPAAGG
jgi:molybdopterin converting factor small subunit